MGLFDFFRRKGKEEKAGPSKHQPDKSKPTGSLIDLDKQQNKSRPPINNAAGAVAPQFYEVQKGDTLSAIAKRQYNDPTKWRAIYEANKDLIKDPDLIHPGQKIKIPQQQKPQNSSKAQK